MSSQKYPEYLSKKLFYSILFCSWAKGHVNEGCDIDLVVILDAFTGDRFQDRRTIVPLRRNINFRIEPIPYSPLSFEAG
jgi:uncharacterized protein